MERFPRARQDRQGFQDRQELGSAENTAPHRSARGKLGLAIRTFRGDFNDESASHAMRLATSILHEIHDAVLREEQTPNLPLPWRSWRASGSAPESCNVPLSEWFAVAEGSSAPMTLSSWSHPIVLVKKHSSYRRRSLLEPRRRKRRSLAFVTPRYVTRLCPRGSSSPMTGLNGSLSGA